MCFNESRFRKVGLFEHLIILSVGLHSSQCIQHTKPYQTDIFRLHQRECHQVHLSGHGIHSSAADSTLISPRVNNLGRNYCGKVKERSHLDALYMERIKVSLTGQYLGYCWNETSISSTTIAFAKR